jgi:hypothetical protein
VEADRPWFLWDVSVSDAEFRRRQGGLLREARSRKRAYWEWLIEGWRRDGRLSP